MAEPPREHPFWWPPNAEAISGFVHDITLSTVVAVLLYGLFVPSVDNKDVFSLLTMIIGYYIGHEKGKRRA